MCTLMSESASAIYSPSPVKTVGRVVTGNVRTNPRSTRSQRGVIAGSAVDESLRAPIEWSCPTRPRPARPRSGARDRVRRPCSALVYRVERRRPVSRFKYLLSLSLPHSSVCEAKVWRVVRGDIARSRECGCRCE